MNRKEISRLMWEAEVAGRIKLPVPRTREQTIELARTARDSNGNLIVPPELFSPVSPYQSPYVPNRQPEVIPGSVAFVSVSYQTVGGTETFHRTLIPRLKERLNIIGFGVTAFGNGDPSLLGVPVIRGEAGLRELLAKADTVVTWGCDTIEELLPKRKQYVVSVHHSDASSHWSNKLQSIPVVDHSVCVNPETASFLRSVLRIPVSHVANCVDPIRITPTLSRAKMRAEYSIPKSHKVVLFGHRLSEEKQPLKAIEIGKNLPKGFTLVVVGDGDLADQCKNSSCVRVVGGVESLANWLEASDVFISLSTYDGYGLSVAEALAFGLPTVATPRGIAVGRARLVEAFAPVSQWCEAIVEASKSVRNRHHDLCNVDQFVSQWESVCRGLTV